MINDNAAGVKRVHDVSEQVAFRMLSGQRALLSRGDHFSQRTHPGKARPCRNSSFFAQFVYGSSLITAKIQA